MKLLIATRNPGKYKEIEKLLRGLPLELVALHELELIPTPEEDQLESADSFAEHAVAKARYFAELTDLAVLAEDSGLCVDALKGEPGVRSKRYASGDLQEELGTDMANNRELLRRLEGVPEGERAAHFESAVAVIFNDDVQVFVGRVDGRILDEPRGEGGFGYDPLFYVVEKGRTMAELSPREKNALSHRGEAIRAARDWLIRSLGSETQWRRKQ